MPSRNGPAAATRCNILPTTPWTALKQILQGCSTLAKWVKPFDALLQLSICCQYVVDIVYSSCMISIDFCHFTTPLPPP